MQTLNSYARLIWVRHLHGISGNCQSPKIGAQMRLCGHFRYAKIFNTRVHVWPFIESIVRKVALIRGSFRLRGYAGGDLEENLSTLRRMPSVRSAHTVFRPAWPTPPDVDVGLFIVSGNVDSTGGCHTAGAPVGGLRFRSGFIGFRPGP